MLMVVVLLAIMLVLVLVLMVVLVVVVAVGACWWYGYHVTHGDEAPAFGVKGKRGRDVETHLLMQTVMMASIVTVWTTWHVGTSLPAHSIAFHCG